MPEPSLAEIIREALAQFQGQLHTSMPAYVIAYDREKNQVDVQPAIRGRRQLADESLVEKDFPVLKGVPIVWPSATGVAITFDLQRGDPVIVHFMERGTDEYRSQAHGKVVSSRDPRRFDISDGFAVPGGWPDRLPEDASADGAMVVKAPEIRLGSANAIKHVALAEDVVEKLNELIDVFNSHTHAVTTTSACTAGGAAATGSAAATGTPQSAASGLGASKVKAE